MILRSLPATALIVVGLFAVGWPNVGRICVGSFAFAV